MSSRHPNTQTFFPAVDGKGKYHRPAAISGRAACGAPVIVDTDPYGAIHVAPDAKAHPVCCKNCRRV